MSRYSLLQKSAVTASDDYDSRTSLKVESVVLGKESATAADGQSESRLLVGILINETRHE